MILKRKNNSGQAVLIVLLSLSVVLVVVLFILSRSITDISLSTKEEDSSRAFSAAEAGVERALVIGNSSGSLELATFDANVASFAQGSSVVTFPLSLKSGDNALFWFKRTGDATVYNGNKVTLCWGSSTLELPAAEVTVFYKSSNVYQVARATFDDPSSSRTPPNNFSSALTSGCTIDNQTFQFKNQINFASLGINGSDELLYMTVKLLYNNTVSHKIGIDVSGNGLLPSQGKKVNSDGSFADANRSIEVYQLHPETPPIFANAIYSSSGIVK
ncbi:MAG: hypothetical protein Q8Q30_01615 [Candidatus Woesebacteria bacterium]|nr:hypothetical protein [Candidatus Woesebacteria bacterium]